MKKLMYAKSNTDVKDMIVYVNGDEQEVSYILEDGSFPTAKDELSIMSFLKTIEINDERFELSELWEEDLLEDYEIVVERKILQIYSAKFSLNFNNNTYEWIERDVEEYSFEWLKDVSLDDEDEIIDIVKDYVYNSMDDLEGDGYAWESDESFSASNVGIVTLYYKGEPYTTYFVE